MKPVEYLSDECTSIEASTTQNAGDPKEHGVFADDLESTKLILTVDCLCKRVPSDARLCEARVVDICQKMGTGDIEAILDSLCDAI